MYELNDAELDAVSAGATGIGGLIGAGVYIHNFLNNNDVDILNQNHTAVNVGAGVALAVLGAAANGLVGRAQA